MMIAAANAACVFGGGRGCLRLHAGSRGRCQIAFEKPHVETHFGLKVDDTEPLVDVRLKNDKRALPRLTTAGETA
jgi:hypothetical protein